MLISWPSRESTFYNFCAWPLSKFVIWSEYATCAISRDSGMTTFFTCAIVHANIPACPGPLLQKVSCATAQIFVIWPKYATRAISRDLWWQPVLSCLSRMLISQPSRERSFYNFHSWPLPIFVIWIKYATCEILSVSQMATFFARPIAQAKISALPGALLL